MHSGLSVAYLLLTVLPVFNRVLRCSFTETVLQTFYINGVKGVTCGVIVATTLFGTALPSPGKSRRAKLSKSVKGVKESKSMVKAASITAKRHP